MKCINCNVTLPDDATECYLCGAKVTTEVIRCPKCFIKLDKEAKKCPKCGHNMEEKQEKEELPKKKLTKKQLVLLVAIPLICIAVVFSAYGIWYYQKLSAFKAEAKDYVASLDENLELISEIASGYNDVYNGKWLIYAEKSSAVEREYAEEIEELVDNRDTFTYLVNEISQKSVNNSDAELILNVFENYDKCHIYVIGKKGTYPGYIESYEKLLSEYKKSVEKLNERIK